MTLWVICRSCPSPIFWLPFGNRYTPHGEGLRQVSHFISEVKALLLSINQVFICQVYKMQHVH